MKIGLISDTHDNLEFIDSAIKKFKDLKVDILIHCGDVTKPENLKKFKGFSKIYVVKGNMDKDIEGLKKCAEQIDAKYYEDYADITLEDNHIAIIHSDDQLKFGSLIESFNYDYIFYGHTHQPISDLVNNATMVNPGSYESKNIAIVDLSTDEVFHIDLSENKKEEDLQEIEEE